MTGGWRARCVAAVVAAVALAAMAVGCSSGGGGSSAGGSKVAPGTGTALTALRVSAGARPAIVDAHDRQVILRGVNLNSLGDYYQDDPSRRATIPVTAADWDAMAAQGFDVVRLLVSWSRLEPRRGHIDTHYIDRIRAAVADAARRGIYTVIDLHQDAWGKGVATPKGVSCPAGTKPALGWDGAPEWATILGGASTCRRSSREDSPADRAAWEAFWTDRDGIQTQLVDTWNALGRAFATNTSVAGFDLLNEPNDGEDSSATTGRMAAFYRHAIGAIRQGERSAHGHRHLIFFEYSVSWQAVDPGFAADPDLVFAPHVYGGSIAPVSVDVNWSYVDGLLAKYRTPVWVGEYGWYQDPPASLVKLRRYAQLEDQHFAGSAWWQWRQACGDPHSISGPGARPDAVVISYHRVGCPGDRDLGIVPEWQQVVTRPYPRAAPGRLTALRSDGAAATLVLSAVAARPQSRLELWVPTRAGHRGPALRGSGIAAVHVRRVAGGYLVRATVCTPTYSVAVAPASSPAVTSAAPPAACT